MKTLFLVTRNSLLLIVALIILTFTNTSYSAVTDTSIPFSNFVYPTNVFPVLLNGEPFRDYELSQDPTSGPTGVASSSIDGASGCPSNNQDPVNCPDSNCNPNTTTDPTINGGVPHHTCGQETTAFWGLYDPDTGSAVCDRATNDGNETFFFRFRLNGNPNNQIAFENNTWLVLIDINDDGWNDFQVVVDGNIGTGANGSDELIIFHNTSTATQSCILGTSCTQRNVFRACNQRNGSTDLNCRTQSHTRSLIATNEFPGSDTNEYFLDIQVPITAFTDNSNARRIFCDTQIHLGFGTSSSPNDTFQKDAVPNCTDDAACNFGGPAPITLSYFKALYSASGVEFTWTTATETGNAGFNIYAQGSGGLEKLNTELIPSKVVNSLYPEHYQYVSENSDGTNFFIADVDIFGNEKFHGPFHIDREYGSIDTIDDIDWTAINAEHKKKELDRTILLKNNALIKSNKIKSELKTLSATKNDIQGIQAELPGVDISVSEEGIYRVTFEDLLSIGADFSGVPASDIALTNFSNPVAIYVYANSGTFGPGSYIEFVGKGHKTLYTDKNVYILTVNPAIALRVGINSKNSRLRNASPWYDETIIIDNNIGYYIGSPTDPWYDTRFIANSSSPKSKIIDFGVDNLAAGGGKIALKLIGGIDFPGYIDHHFVLELNGVQIADNTFDGIIEHTEEIELQNTAAKLKNGTNQVKLIIPGDNAPTDVIYLDSVSLTYPRLYSAKDSSLIFYNKGESFSVGNLDTPNAVIYSITERNTTRINAYNVTQNGSSYTASFAGDKTKQIKYVVNTDDSVKIPDMQLSEPYSDIKSGSAEYLIISHPDFIEGLTDLINERQNYYSVKSVNVDDIYAQFSHSIFDPYAIKNYIKYAYENLGTRFILLVGADTYDYLNYLGSGSFSFIPTLYDKTYSVVTFGPSDSLFADINGDKVQDIAIGRFPARTTTDLDMLVQKTLLYPGTKNNKAVFAADIDDGDISYSELSDELASFLPAEWTLDTAYVQDIGIDAAKEILINSINDAAGSRAFTSFMGHSSYRIWTFSGLFNQNDAQNLTNHDNPTVVAQFGCWNTYYVEPRVNTMAHKFLLSGTNGASAISGPTGLANNDSQAIFGKLFYEYIFSGLTIGEASMQAKQTMSSMGHLNPDVIMGWNLLGDPALVVTD